MKNELLLEMNTFCLTGRGESWRRGVVVVVSGVRQ